MKIIGSFLFLQLYTTSSHVLTINLSVERSAVFQMFWLSALINEGYNMSLDKLFYNTSFQANVFAKRILKLYASNATQ